MPDSEHSTRPLPWDFTLNKVKVNEARIVKLHYVFANKNSANGNMYKIISPMFKSVRELN